MKILYYDQPFFESLIDNLNRSSIIYCIVGDYIGLPESINHDIDFWTNNLDDFRKVLLKTVRNNKLKILFDNHTTKGCNITIYKYNKKEILITKIDIFTICSYKSLVTLVDKNTINDNIKIYKNFKVANEESEAIQHFLYPLFEWGTIKEKYKNEIISNCNSQIFQITLQKLFGRKCASDIINNIHDKNWRKIENNRNRYRIKAFINKIFKLEFWINFFSTTGDCIFRFLKPSGKYIVVCGLDGAGKTTILNELNLIFEILFKRKKVFYGYWRPYLLPEIREILGKKNSKEIEYNKDSFKIKDEKDMKFSFLSFLKFFYYLIDFVIGPFKFHSVRHRGGIVLFDRHYIDMAVYPERFKIKLRKSMIWFFYCFIPKPDITFFLWTTPEDILKRKDEFTKSQILEQLYLYNKAKKYVKNFIPLQTNKTVEEEIVEILDHISINVKERL